MSDVLTHCDPLEWPTAVCITIYFPNFTQRTNSQRSQTQCFRDLSPSHALTLARSRAARGPQRPPQAGSSS